MAMGLGFLGRESSTRSTFVGALHAVTAALGGALSGGLLGFAGDAIGVPGNAVAWVVGAVGTLAFVLALRRRPMELGRPCQVPQRWSKTMPAERLYGTWGLMLGSGVATLIPYSAFLLLLSGQFVAGPAIGAVTGAVYGLAREAVALVGVRGRLQPVGAMTWLERYAAPARAANATIVALGAVSLVIFAL